MIDISIFNPDYLKMKVPQIFDIARSTESIEELRNKIYSYTLKKEYLTFDDYGSFAEGSIIRVRDEAHILYRLLMPRSEQKANFSVLQTIMDIAKGKPRPDLTPAFYAEILYLFLGLEGRGPGRKLADFHLIPIIDKGRQTAIQRSRQLDELAMEVQIRSDKFISGLEKESIIRRGARREKILKSLNADMVNWDDWHWHVRNIYRSADKISLTTSISKTLKKSVENAKKNKIPFGITPYYLSLMDDNPDDGRDRSIRAQVLPPESYIERISNQDRTDGSMDFMLESDTSPIDLITRRYPSICIFKPFNTCPQICVYCQRNWEIEDAMQPGAMATKRDMEKAIEYIRQHKGIHEVLVTGGDPLAMGDNKIDYILKNIADIPTIERIRIGSRTLVTLPMRITDSLVSILAKYRIPGKRQVAVVTHVQHPYEVTPDMMSAVEKLRAKGIPVFNQLVYTFYVSRRFEAAYLRRLLSLIGIEPYYTFNCKGKDETIDYRVPIARLLQEQNEESRLLPGLSRTDEAVFNVPGLGKNYLRARQHRDIISILPTGNRVYEFHPWEKNISNVIKTYITEDMPILDYLIKLDALGEDMHEYETIWYYY
jgi:lysine 2,3-aminomutase